MRLFTAITLPDEVKAHVAEIQRSLRDRFGEKLSWTAQSNFHITLKFLGEVPEEVVAQLRDSLRPIEFEPMRLFVDRFQPFPPRGPTRVLTAGIGGDVHRLSALFDSLEQACASHGIEVESRRFTPHITIGRARGGIRFVQHQIEPGPVFAVTSFALIQSKLTQAGSIYEPIENFSVAK